VYLAYQQACGAQPPGECNNTDIELLWNRWQARKTNPNHHYSDVPLLTTYGGYMLQLLYYTNNNFNNDTRYQELFYNNWCADPMHKPSPKPKPNPNPNPAPKTNPAPEPNPHPEQVGRRDVLQARAVRGQARPVRPRGGSGGQVVRRGQGVPLDEPAREDPRGHAGGEPEPNP